MGFLDKVGFTKLKEGLAKTRDTLVGKVAKLVATKSTIAQFFRQRFDIPLARYP